MDYETAELFRMMQTLGQQQRPRSRHHYLPKPNPPKRFAMHGHKMRYHHDPLPSLTNRAYRLKQIPPHIIAKIKAELAAK